jgi:tyrosyl-DNA phosphodiesterase-1
LWYQDFPVKEEKKTSCDFEDTLVDYVTRLGLSQFTSQLRKYDYSSAKVVLITAVPGTFYDEKMNNYGHLKMRKVLGRLHLPEKFKSAPILCQYSSLGMLGEDWLYTEFLESFTASYSKSSSSLSKDEESKPTLKKQKSKTISSTSPIHFVWPTVDFVRNSIDGYGAGGSLCCNKYQLSLFQ